MHKNLKFKDAVYNLITQLTDNEELYDSLEDAADDIDGDVEQGNDRTDEINC